MTKRQEEITKEAIKLISEKGIQGLTIKNLAKGINVSEPALYRHFENKTSILVAILDSFHSLFPQDGSLSLLEDKTSVEKIIYILNQHLLKFVETPPLVSVIFSDEIFKNEKILANKIKELINRNESLFLNLIMEGQSSGEIRNDLPAEHIVMFILGAFRLEIKKWELSFYAFDLLKEGSKLLESIRKILINNN